MLDLVNDWDLDGHLLSSGSMVWFIKINGDL